MRQAVFILVLVVLLAFVATGCATDTPANPSFALSTLAAECAWGSMEKSPASLRRPVVVLAGIFDSGDSAIELTDRFRSIASPDSQFITVAFTGVHTFDKCASRVIDT